MDHRSESPSPVRAHGLALGLGGILAISTDSLITRGVDASAWDVAFWSGLWSFVATTVVLRVGSGTTPVGAIRRDGAPLLGSAALQAASAIFFILGIKHTTVANVVVITAAAPAAAALIAWAVLGERTTRRVFTAIALAMAGIVVVVGGSTGSDGAWGELAAVGAIVAFGCNLTLWRRHPTLSRTAVVGLAGLMMAIVSALPAAVVGLSLRSMLLLVLMGAVFGPIARVSLASATRHLTAAEVSLFTPVETVAAALGAWLLFDETPAAPTWLGGAIVLGAVTIGLTGTPTAAPDPSDRDARR